MAGAGHDTETFDIDDVDNINAFYRDNGYVIIRAFDSKFCSEAIEDQVRHILLTQPWEQKLRVFKDAKELFIDSDTHEYIQELCKTNLDKKTLDRYEAVWPLHKSFGACCDSSTFHLSTTWAVRQNEALYSIVKVLLDLEEDDESLWVDINRSIQLLPGEGMPEFLHWDLDKWGAFRPDSSVQGKVCFTKGQFVCVPGTHTPAFHDEFQRKYREYYPVKKNNTKTGLDEKKPDPADLKGRKRIIPVPAGSAVFWSSNLLHGHDKTPSKGSIGWGMYLGYLTAKRRPEYHIHATKRIKFINERMKDKGYLNGRSTDELADRIYSYVHGRAPILYPSMDVIHLYPYAYVSRPQHYQNMIFDRLSAANIKKYTRTYDDKDIKRYEVIPWNNPDYVPPALTKLGRLLLGISDEQYAEIRNTAFARFGVADHEEDKAPDEEEMPMGDASEEEGSPHDKDEEEMPMGDASEEEGSSHGNVRGKAMDSPHDKGQETESEGEDKTEPDTHTSKRRKNRSSNPEEVEESTKHRRRAVADVSDEEEGPKVSSLVETRDKKKVPDSDDEDTPIVHWID